MTKPTYQHKTPLWQVKKKIKELQLELELLQKDPSTNHDEIAGINFKLSGVKLEYAERRMKLEQSLKKGVAE